MKISYVNLIHQYKKEKKDLIRIFDTVLKSGNYVGGNFVKKFENSLAKYCVQNIA